MRIIKHGSVYRFDCPECGCQFEMTYKELSEDQQSTVITINHKCPDCDTVVHGYEHKLKSNLTE